MSPAGVFRVPPATPPTPRYAQAHNLIELPDKKAPVAGCCLPLSLSLLASSASAGEHRLRGWDCYGPPYSSLLFVRLSLRDDVVILFTLLNVNTFLHVNTLNIVMEAFSVAKSTNYT